MAANLRLGGVDPDRIFLGTDWRIDFKVADLDADLSGVTAIDATGWAVCFDVRRLEHAPSALVSKTIGAGLEVVGDFDSVLESSTQAIRLTLTGADLTPQKFGARGGAFYYSLKRTDAPRGILAYGRIVIERATQI